MTPIDQPGWDTAVVVLALWVAAAVVWRHGRRKEAHPGGDRARSDAARTGLAGAHGGAAHGRAARMDRDLHGDRGRGDAGEPGHQPDHALTDDEVVALARWFIVGRATRPTLSDAVAKIERHAADILNADRAGRRG